MHLLCMLLQSVWLQLLLLHVLAPLFMPSLLASPALMPCPVLDVAIAAPPLAAPPLDLPSFPPLDLPLQWHGPGDGARAGNASSVVHALRDPGRATLRHSKLSRTVGMVAVRVALCQFPFVAKMVPADPPDPLWR